MTLREEKWRKCCKFAANAEKSEEGQIYKNTSRNTLSLIVLKTFCFVCMPREHAFVHFLNKKLLQCAVNFSIVIYSLLKCTVETGCDEFCAKLRCHGSFIKVLTRLKVLRILVVLKTNERWVLFLRNDTLSNVLLIFKFFNC